MGWILTDTSPLTLGRRGPSLQMPPQLAIGLRGSSAPAADHSVNASSPSRESIMVTNIVRPDREHYHQFEGELEIARILPHLTLMLWETTTI